MTPDPYERWLVENPAPRLEAVGTVVFAALMFGHQLATGVLRHLRSRRA